MNDDDDDDEYRPVRSRSEHDRARTKTTERIDDPIQRALANYGLDARDILATTPLRLVPPEPSGPTFVPRARLEELGWPRRALDEAQHADVERGAITARFQRLLSSAGFGIECHSAPRTLSAVASLPISSW